MDGGGELTLKIGNLALEGGVLFGILFRQLIQILTQFLVLPEESESNEWRGDRQNGKQHNNQLNKGHGVLGVLDSLF
jgi:hypothetical protein